MGFPEPVCMGIHNTEGPTIVLEILPFFGARRPTADDIGHPGGQYDGKGILADVSPLQGLGSA